MTPQKPDQLVAPQWLFGQLRATAFLGTPAADTAGPALWEETVHIPAPSELRQRVGTAIVYQAEATFGSSQLALRVEPSRVDLICNPSIGEPAVYPSIGTEEEALPVFLEYASRLLASIKGGVLRVAFGTILVSPVGAKEEGYHLLDALLPAVTVDPVDSQDFLYRINRPRPLESITGNANRLSEWSVVQVQGGILAVGPSGMLTVPLGPSQFALRLMLDISTAVDNAAAFADNALKPLLDEVVGMGRDIWMRGDTL